MDAERRTQLAQAQVAAEVAKAVLSQFVGVPPPELAVSPPNFLQLPAEQTAPAFDTARNPVTIEQDAASESSLSGQRNFGSGQADRSQPGGAGNQVSLAV